MLYRNNGYKSYDQYGIDISKFAITKTAGYIWDKYKLPIMIGGGIAVGYVILSMIGEVMLLRKTKTK